VRIDYGAHALFRINERARKFGLDNEELRQRIVTTIALGKTTTRHRKKGSTTYYCYYTDGLTIYAITQPKKYGHLLITVIIERGRP
jgi:hypothetical protein